MEAVREEVRITLTKIHNTIIAKIAHWTIRISKVILSMCKLQNIKTHPLISQEELEKIKDKSRRHSNIFTDGCKQEKTTGCAAVYNEKTIN